MTKKDFETFIRQNLKELPLEKQELILKKMDNVWLPEIRKKFDDKVEKSYIKCPKCGKYSLKKKFKVTSEEVLVPGVLIWRDSGYGDYDKFGDVLYEIYYYICPCCDFKFEKKRIELKVTNTHTRYERRP